MSMPSRLSFMNDVLDPDITKLCCVGYSIPLKKKKSMEFHLLGTTKKTDKKKSSCCSDDYKIC